MSSVNFDRSRPRLGLVKNAYRWITGCIRSPSQKAIEVRFDALLKRMSSRGVANFTQRTGCSKTQIGELEEKYHINLPLSYRLYLTAIGEKSGRLFTHDHLAVQFNCIINTTCNLRAYIENEKLNQASEFSLPDDALIICSRLDSQFQFIICDNDYDSPVWYFNETDLEIKQSHDSVISWLEYNCAQSERAIDSGYYNRYPNGTTP